MIAEDIKKQINEAMKAGDALRVSTLRMLSSELHNAEIDNHGELSSEAETAVVKKEAKKRKDAIEAYESAGRMERAESERAELAILQEFLPAEMSDEELSQIVDEVLKETGASDMSSMGRVMGEVMKKTQGNASGERVSALVKAKLQ